MIRAEEARIAEGMAKYGIHGGVLRSVESLAVGIEFASSIDRAKTIAAAKAIDSNAEAETDDDVVESDAQAPPAAPPANETETQPTIAAQPLVEAPKPKPKRERKPRQAQARTVRQTASPDSANRCRVIACINGSGELGLCDGCRPLFMCWRRYTMVGQPSPITPTPQQEQAFKLLQTELEQKKPA